MIKVPSFLLKRLYVKGSLRNNHEGFQFEIKNSLGSGYGNSLLPLTLDGEELPLESSFFILDEKETSFDSVSEEQPFTLPLNKKLTITVKGIELAPEPHSIGMRFVVKGLGQLGFEVNDSAS
jgi:hydroxymethylglutaryl-CoA reductase (NADPH)